MTTRLGLAIVLAALPVASAWSGEPDRPHHADLGMLALEALASAQATPIMRHAEAYRAGALDADRELSPEFHRYSPETGDGRALHYVAKATARLQTNLTARNATEEDARQLGILTHVLIDLTQPLHTGNGSIDAAHHAEYEAAASEHARSPSIEQVSPRDGNITLLAQQIANVSAQRSAELELLLQEEGPWSLRIADLTNAALEAGLPHVALALATILPPPTTPPAPAAITPTPTAPTQRAPPSATTTTPAADTPPSGSANDELATPVGILILLAGCAIGLIVRRHERRPPQ